jgi:dTDP-glucose pyrophosphorylase
MNVVITMAGDGTRFRSAGFCSPKHMIAVKGRTLFEWSLLSLKHFFNNTFIFVTREENKDSAFIRASCESLGVQEVKIVELDHLTSGQAETAILGGPCVTTPDAPFAIYNIDTYVEPSEIYPALVQGDGWVPAFEAEGDKWSFVKFGDDFRVTAVTEKQRISSFGTIGLYYFKSFRIFENCYQRYSFSGYKERFVAPLYNVLLENPGSEVYTHIIKKSAVHVLGTPEDVICFWPEFARECRAAGANA